MSDIMNKRVSKPALKFSPGNVLGRKGNLKAVRANSRAGAPAYKGGRQGKSTVSRSAQQLNVNSREIQASNESETDSEFEYELEIQELEAEIRNNSELGTEILENSFAALSALFSVLPNNKLEAIARNLGEDQRKGEAWLRAILINEEDRRTKTNENIKSEEYQFPTTTKRHMQQQQQQQQQLWV